jgi:hypothetical protein
VSKVNTVSIIFQNNFFIFGKLYYRYPLDIYLGKMQYENCPRSESLFGLSNTAAGLIVVIVVLLLIYYFARGTKAPWEKFGDRADEIMTALDNTMKEKGNIVDFKRSIADPKFSPTKYIYLADLYRNGKLTKEAVNKALDDSSI